MISAALLAGLAALWFWTVMNDEDGVVGPLARWLHRGWTRKWSMCPWCSGAWIAIAASLFVYHPSVAAAIVTAFAAAAVTGVVGSYISGD